MKLGTIVSMESLCETPLARLENKPLSEIKIVKKQEEPENPTAGYVFPDVYVPDELDFNQLKNTTESLVVNSDIATENIDLLQDSIDIVRDIDQITPLAALSIKTQLKNIESVFPETPRQDVQYLDDVLTSDSPMIVQATVEALMNSMASLRPIASRSLNVSKNISKFLQSSEKINKLQERLTLSKDALNRSARPEIEGRDPQHPEDRYKDLYPKIVKAVQTGYSVDQIPDIIGTNTDDTLIPSTAIIAIAKGIEKTPLSRTRTIGGQDIGSLSSFIQITSDVQDAEIELLNKVASTFSAAIQSDEQVMVASKVISEAVQVFYSKVNELSSTKAKTEQSLQFAGENTSGDSIQFLTYPDGPQVVVLGNGRSLAPRTFGETSYGIIEPSSIPDMIDAIESKLIPPFNAVKKKAKVISDTSSKIEQQLPAIFSDKIRMTDIAGSNMNAVFNKLLSSLKLTNDMMTVSVETTVNMIEAIADISRGISVITES